MMMMDDTSSQNLELNPQMTELLYAAVDPRIAHPFRQWLKMQNFEDSCQKSCKLSSTLIAIPVTKSFVDKTLKDKDDSEDYVFEDFSFKLIRTCSPLKTKDKPSPHDVACLIKALQSLVHPTFKWNEELTKDLPTRWEKHGDLLMLSENCFQMEDWKTLDQELWVIVASAFHTSRVAKRGHITDNDFRSPTVTLLLGTNSWVEHVDNKIRYQYDITKCMFSAGNITEKIRIGFFDCTGETVVDLFAGIGYFTLPYLVHANASLVYACEWNPDAVMALRRNLTSNGVTNRCIVLEGDNRKTCPKRVADRVNLGLIPSSEACWETACAALKLDSGGILHVHGNVTSKMQCTKHTMPSHLITKCTSPNRNHTDTAEPHSCDKYLVDVCPKTIYNEYSDSHSDSRELKKMAEEKSLSQQVQTKGSNTLQLRKDKSKKHPISEWTEWASDVSQKMKEILQNQTSKDWLVTVIHVEHVKSYAPHIDHLVADIKCIPN